MVYIQLTNPIKDYDKVRIKEISFFDTNGESNTMKSLAFKYQVYKKIDNEFIVFYDKYIDIIDQDYINMAMTANIITNNLSAYETICKQLLQYLIDQSLESGTIEKE